MSAERRAGVVYALHRAAGVAHRSAQQMEKNTYLASGGNEEQYIDRLVSQTLLYHKRIRAEQRRLMQPPLWQAVIAYAEVFQMHTHAHQIARAVQPRAASCCCCERAAQTLRRAHANLLTWLRLAGTIPAVVTAARHALISPTGDSVHLELLLAHHDADSATWYVFREDGSAYHVSYGTCLAADTTR